MDALVACIQKGKEPEPRSVCAEISYIRNPSVKVTLTRKHLPTFTEFFFDSKRDPYARRWVGLLLLEALRHSHYGVLLRDKPNYNKICEQSSEVLKHQLPRDLKVVAGYLLKTCLKQKSIQNLNPNVDDNQQPSSFPTTESSQWILEFETYLRSCSAFASRNGHAFLPLSLLINNKNVASKYGPFLSTVSDRYFTIIVPEKQDLNFIDIPLRNIQSTRIVKASIVSSPGHSQPQVFEFEFILRPEHYLWNAAETAAAKIVAAFYREQEATDARDATRTFISGQVRSGQDGDIQNSRSSIKTKKQKSVNRAEFHTPQKTTEYLKEAIHTFRTPKQDPDGQGFNEKQANGSTCSTPGKLPPSTRKRKVKLKDRMRPAENEAEDEFAVPPSPKRPKNTRQVAKPKNDKAKQTARKNQNSHPTTSSATSKNTANHNKKSGEGKNIESPHEFFTTIDEASIREDKGSASATNDKLRGAEINKALVDQLDSKIHRQSNLPVLNPLRSTKESLPSESSAQKPHLVRFGVNGAMNQASPVVHRESRQQERHPLRNTVDEEGFTVPNLPARHGLHSASSPLVRNNAGPSRHQTSSLLKMSMSTPLSKSFENPVKNRVANHGLIGLGADFTSFEDKPRAPRTEPCERSQSDSSSRQDVLAEDLSVRSQCDETCAGLPCLEEPFETPKAPPLGSQAAYPIQVIEDIPGASKPERTTPASNTHAHSNDPFIAYQNDANTSKDSAALNGEASVEDIFYENHPPSPRPSHQITESPKQDHGTGSQLSLRVNGQGSPFPASTKLPMRISPLSRRSFLPAREECVTNAGNTTEVNTIQQLRAIDCTEPPPQTQPKPRTVNSNDTDKTVTGILHEQRHRAHNGPSARPDRYGARSNIKEPLELHHHSKPPSKTPTKSFSNTADRLYYQSSASSTPNSSLKDQALSKEASNPSREHEQLNSRTAPLQPTMPIEQRNMIGALTMISRRLLAQLDDRRTTMDTRIRLYAEGASHIVTSLSRQHECEYNIKCQNLQTTKTALNERLTAQVGPLGRNTKAVNNKMDHLRRGLGRSKGVIQNKIIGIQEMLGRLPDST